MFIIPGKKSVSWQPVAVVEDSKTTQRGKKTTLDCKNQSKIKGKFRLNGICKFLVAVVIEFLSKYEKKKYIYI